MQSSIRTTFIRLFAIVTGLAVILGVMSAVATNAILRNLFEFTDRTAPRLVELEGINTHVLRANAEALSIPLVLEEADELESELNEMAEEREQLEASLDRYEALLGAEAVELRAVADAYMDASFAFADIAQQETDLAELGELKEDMEELENAYIAELNAELATATDEFIVARFQSERIAQVVGILSILAIPLQLGFAFFVLVQMRRRLVNPLSNLTTAASEIAEGDLERRVNVEGAKEFHELTHTFNTMADQLEKKIEEAEAANRFKTQLLARVSHELRTPLGAVIGFAGALNADETMKPSHNQPVEMILQYSHELKDLIDELLEQSRWELSEERRKLVVADVDPQAVVQAVEGRVAGAAQRKGLELKTIIEPDVPQTITTDEAKLRQVLNNLAINAIKFTDAGSVTLRAFVPKNGQWAVSVTDTGKGISEQELETVFQPFRQVDESYTREEGGVGLGLSIVQQFVSLMGGEVKLESKLNQGSTFTVILPQQIQEHQAA
jgi:signal transduction histidine kinase